MPESLTHQLTAFLERTPFRPYSVELKNGTRFQVDTPKMIAFRDGGGAALLASGRPIMFRIEDVTRIIDDSTVDYH